MKKIRRITAINQFGVEKYHWSANTLLWDELPKCLLERIKLECPNYKLKIEYY